jgi:hypothetical protein
MDQDPSIQTRRRRVYMSVNWGKRGGYRTGGDDVTLILEDMDNAPCARWIYYKTLESTNAAASNAARRRVDVLYVHGESRALVGATLQLTPMPRLFDLWVSQGVQTRRCSLIHLEVYSHTMSRSPSKRAFGSMCSTCPR